MKLSIEQTVMIYKKLKDYGFEIIDTEQGHKEQMDIFNINTICEDKFCDLINEALEKVPSCPTCEALRGIIE